MPKTLIIAEKPSVARDLAAALGKVAKNGDFFENEEYIITSAVGHLVELYMPQDYDKKKYGRWTLAELPLIPEKFGLKAIEKTESQFKLCKKLMQRKDVNLIINACDAGREGELIFTYLYELAECQKPYQRLWMQSMTPDAIRDAFGRLRTPEEMLPLQEAARSRSEADWLIGINGTRAITMRLYGARVKELATVGRVQTPTLTLVIERELAIRGFTPTPYWRLSARYGLAQGEYEGTYQKESWKAAHEHDKVDRLWNEADARALMEQVQRISRWQVTEATKRAEQAAPRLYDLTTLQREANNRYGFPAGMTLKIAQALYERHKVLTYPRTDSQALPEDYIPVARRTLSAIEGELAPFARKALEGVRPNKRIFNNAQVSDHFAIIPTGEAPKNLSEQEQKIYDMVARRFIAIFYPSAQIDNTTRITQSGDLRFKTEGKVLVSPGWMEVHGRANLESEPLPALHPADNGSAAFISTQLHAESTKPPARYTEATLLSAMEGAGKLIEDEELADAMKERGLGTPATRANIIDHIINTGYITRERRELVPTAKAETLYDFLKVLGADALTRPDLTGEWEFRLRQMEERKLSREVFMQGIAQQAQLIVAAAKNFEEAKEAATPTDVISPTDQKPLLEKTRFFESQDGKIKIWKVLGGRRLSIAEIGQLISTGSVGPLEGFVSKFGRPFSAKLKLDENLAVKYDFEGQARVSVTPEALKAGEYVGQCPVDDGKVYAYEGGYACENAIGEKPSCGFKLPKVLLGIELPIAEVRKLLNKEETSPIEGFLSKRTGKKFTSILYLKKNGQLGWKFPPRPKKEKGEKAPKGKKASKADEVVIERPTPDADAPF
jgi:DNA topoisomerase III